MTEPKLWVDLEQATIDPVLAGLPWTPQLSCPPTITRHSTVGAILRVTQLLFRTTPTIPPPRPLTPVLGTHTFLSGLKDLKSTTPRILKQF